MAMYNILIPHKKLKTSFVEFGGTFGGTLRDPIETYNRYMYWVFGIPDANITSGWYSSSPKMGYMKNWRDHIEKYDRPDLFNGEYRKLFGYDRAVKLFKYYS